MSIKIITAFSTDSDIQKEQIQAEKFQQWVETLCLTLYPKAETMNVFVEKMEKEIEKSIDEFRFVGAAGSMWDPTSVIVLALSSCPTKGDVALFAAVTFENLSRSGPPTNPEYLILDIVLHDELAQEKNKVFSLESLALREYMKRPNYLREFQSMFPKPLYSYFQRKAKFWSGVKERPVAVAISPVIVN